jgi:hypothetical protein
MFHQSTTVRAEKTHLSINIWADDVGAGSAAHLWSNSLLASFFTYFNGMLASLVLATAFEWERFSAYSESNCLRQFVPDFATAHHHAQFASAVVPSHFPRRC